MKTIIFGGAFDPPHNEHVMMLKAAIAATGATRAVVVPTYSPPHKSSAVLPFEVREGLCRAAFEGIDGVRVVVDDIERRRGGDNYSCLVLPILKKKYGDDTVFLMGGDSLRYLDTWRDPGAILAASPVLAVARVGFGEARAMAEDIMRRLGGSITVIEPCEKGVSSARVRATLMLGENCDDIPAEVGDMIRREGLMREMSETVKKVRESESDELYEHTRQVIFRALDLNSLHNLKCAFREVFLAALLHDNAKERKDASGYDIPKDSVGTPVQHQFLGAAMAEKDYGVTSPAVIFAIACHTTAKPDMTTFEKLIYTADSTSYDRMYDPIPALREECDADFEKGFRAVLRYTVDKLHSKGGAVYPLTEDAAKFYLDRGEDETTE